MAAGLQVWDANGLLILDATHRCGRVLGVRAITGGFNDSFTDDRLSPGTPFYAFQRDKSFHLKYGFGGIMSPSFSFSGNTLSWTYQQKIHDYDEYAAGSVIIGVF